MQRFIEQKKKAVRVGRGGNYSVGKRKMDGAGQWEPVIET